MSVRMESSEMYIPTFDDVTAAHTRIKPYIHRTPVLTSSYFNGLTEAELHFKCENFQKAGVFKARGATNAVFGLIRVYAADSADLWPARKPQHVVRRGA